MAQTVRVTGLRETRRAFEKGSDELKELDTELVRIAEPVAQDARAKLARFSGVGDVRIRRRGFEVSVQQKRRTVNGKHPDFGRTQMLRAFIPALEENRARIERDVEHWLDKVFARADL